MARKRANGEGSLRQRNNGSWELSFMEGFGPDGKRKYKTFSAKTRKEVLAKGNAYKEAKSRGLVTDVNYTFSEWADIWFESHKDNVAPTTQENYRYTLKTLKRFFSQKKIRDIKPYDVEMMLRQLSREGRSSSGLLQCRGMMYQIMNKAEANDLVSKNVVRFAEKMRHNEPVKRKEVFTAEEIAILLEKLPHNRIGWSIRLLLGTGMRSQELLALEPRHIEPDGSVIHIEQAINMHKGTAVVGKPKSRDSYRDIPVPANIRYCAIALRETEKTFIWEERKKGSPCNPSFFQDQFRRALEAIPEMRVLTPHCCRHTYVSQMQALGVDLTTIQSMVGHADIDMTKHYLHVQESVRQDAIKRFDEAFSVNGNSPDDPDSNVIRLPRVV